MTIRAKDILEPVPIWDRGLMGRRLTLKETRALLDEFRKVRAAYGVLRAAQEETDEGRAPVLGVLKLLMEARTKEQKKRALQFAEHMIERYGEGDYWQRVYFDECDDE
jgi:hypothetical protein